MRPIRLRIAPDGSQHQTIGQLLGWVLGCLVAAVLMGAVVAALHQSFCPSRRDRRFYHYCEPHPDGSGLWRCKSLRRSCEPTDIGWECQDL